MASKCRRWHAQPLTPLMEGPADADDEILMQQQDIDDEKESSWDVVREWFRIQKGDERGGTGTHQRRRRRRQDLRLLLSVLGCPLAPIPLLLLNTTSPTQIPIHHIPIEVSRANYIIQQYMAATGCLKKKKEKEEYEWCWKNMYAAGKVRMVCWETQGKSSTGGGWENGCFVVWQMTPSMWSLELVVGGNKVLAGSNGKIVWCHTPWLGTHAAKGPLRPLRRLIQGLDPRSTGRVFEKAECVGEKRMGGEECFVLKVAADRAAVMERNEGAAEVIRHVLFGYFSQKTGLLTYVEDSHLTRVRIDQATNGDGDVYYWETTIGSSIGDYREVDGVLIAHRGRSVATVFRFGEIGGCDQQQLQKQMMSRSRSRMEEVWEIEDVAFNVPGLSFDSFIPPALPQLLPAS